MRVIYFRLEWIWNLTLLQTGIKKVSPWILSSSDPASLMFAIQQQALGSIQWTIIASGLKETSYTITSLSKSVRYAFRVLTITSKAFSKPSPATDPMQLLDRGLLLSTSSAKTYRYEDIHVSIIGWCCLLVCLLSLSRFLPSGGSGDCRQTGCCLRDWKWVGLHHNHHQSRQRCHHLEEVVILLFTFYGCCLKTCLFVFKQQPWSYFYTVCFLYNTLYCVILNYV